MRLKKKQNIFEFMKTVVKDMKDYDNFAEKELPQIKEKLESKQQIELSPQQEKEAKRLQKNTINTVNTLKENMYNQTVGIEVFSETVTNPIDIVGAAIGGKIGHTLSKNCQNKKLSGLMTFIGTLIGFLPVAIMEAKFTNAQKKAEKIGTMLSMKELENNKKFADYTEDDTYKNIQLPKELSPIFNEFAK